MKEWLEEIVTRLQSVQSPKKKFVSSTCVACLVQKCGIKQCGLKKFGFVFPLLKMLKVQPESNVCPNVSLLSELTATDFRYIYGTWLLAMIRLCCLYVCRSNIAKAVELLCEEAIKAGTREPCWDWLYVLPLYHFMKGLSEPFMGLQHDFRSIQFNATAKELDLYAVKKNITNGYGEQLDVWVFAFHVILYFPLSFVEKFYPTLEPLFAADPQLLYDFIYICPEEEYQSLFSRIPADLSLALLLSLTKSLTFLFRDDVYLFYNIHMYRCECAYFFSRPGGGLH